MLGTRPAVIRRSVSATVVGIPASKEACFDFPAVVHSVLVAYSQPGTLSTPHHEEMLHGQPGLSTVIDRYEGVHLCQSCRDNKWDAEAEGRAFGKLVIGSAQAAEQAKA